MRLHTLVLGAVLGVGLCLGCGSALAVNSQGDGLWTDGAIWDTGLPPDPTANNGFGEAIFINNDIVVPAGVEYVNNNEVDPNTGDPLDQNGDLLGDNLWFSFQDVPGGVSLTVQDGARVGSQFQTVGVAGSNPRTINVESGGEYVTVGLNNSAADFTVNVERGGTLTYDATLQPPFPNPGFFRGNIEANAGASTTINIGGTLDIKRIDNANAEFMGGTLRYNLLDGAQVNQLAFPGQAFGVNSTPLPRTGFLDYDLVTIEGRAVLRNAFVGTFDGGLDQVPAGLKVDVADGTVLDSSGGADANTWSAFVTDNGGDPALVAGPRRARVRGNGLSGAGAIELDVHAIAMNEVGDAVDRIFHDALSHGSSNPNENSFSGDFMITYVGPEITDTQVDAVNMQNPSLLVINGATNSSSYSLLDGLEVPSAIWFDGSRHYEVEFAPLFFGEAGFPFPAGTPNPQLVFTQIESIAVIEASIDGDFNGDGLVNAADYTVYRDNLGGDESVFALGSGDESGTIDSLDLLLWEANYGSVAPAATAAVPEPATALFALIAGLGLVTRSRRS